jgi:hypothetical protein
MRTSTKVTRVAAKRPARFRARESQMAHDLGNSLGAVSLHLQVLSGLLTGPDQREHAEAAIRQIRVATGQLAELRILIRES